ncbi:MAG: nucleotide sugar dehydrogenase [Gammaproteobacteria bacterium]|nr:MAG: nucleotide sugar dehydrogenase [Gammaproteobacteria bacterium]
MAFPTLDRVHIAVIGLGYVGLPLAVAFGRRYPTLGFDIDARRIAALAEGIDHTREVEPAELRAADKLRFSADAEALGEANVYIVAVPTPVDAHKRPDLRALHAASDTVGRALSPGDVVVYESTVFPGATEEECVPRLEAASGLRFNRDFFVGYSPERINPGDRTHRLENIVKVTSGSTPEAAEFIDRLYASIVPAGTHRAASIKVAEAAKVIENTQRDLNIALINELALIFHRLGIDTQAVLEAAGTKWNFLPFRPGLVGGHCIGVDPYYLTYKAQALGYHPEVILAGRRINDGMGEEIALRVIKLMTARRMSLVDARVLVLGLTFKENCPDIRNTRVVDLIRELETYHARVEVYDPWVDPDEAERCYGLRPVAEPEAGAYDAIVLAVAHDEFAAMGAARIRALGKPGAVLFDIKSVLPADAVDDRL